MARLPQLTAAGTGRRHIYLETIMRFQNTPFVIAILYHFLITSATPPCYYSDGTIASSNYQPCNSNLSSGSHSACCALGRTPADVCFSSGLCLTGSAYNSNGLIFANGCTDPTGQDRSCQQYCTSKLSQILCRLIY